MEQFDKQNLQQLSIYELRTIARQVGVKSPTTKKHKELIDCILKIQSGEEQAFSTKKGRPPKIINLVNQALDINKEEGVPVDYKYADESTSSYFLCDSGYVDGIHSTTYPCQGIVREVNGKKYVYDYLSSKRFAYIEETRQLNRQIKKGDFVKGRAFETNPQNGILSFVDEVNFDQQQECATEKQTKFYSETFTDLKNIYTNVEKDNNLIKVVVELEADNYGIVNMHNKCLYFYSAEYEDIKRSYNAVLDCVNTIEILAEKNKEFSLYLVDIDYIYTVLNAYLIHINERPDIDACQLIKKLFIAVKNCKGGELHIYNKCSANNNRNSYLDAIINKYLS